MSSHARTVARMREARISPAAWCQSLDTLRQPSLAKAVRSKAFDLGEEGLLSYIVEGGQRKGAPTTVAVCSVFAKELVLLGKEVHYLTLPELVVAATKPDSAWTYNLEHLGSGYLVVGDISSAGFWPVGEWQIAQAVLSSHISRGGGAILGAPHPQDTVFCSDLLFAFDSFERVAVE